MPRTARPDVGRVVMVPAAAILSLLDLRALVTAAPTGGPAGALRWSGDALVCAFYFLVVRSYLRRGPAVASTGSVAASVVAVAATVSSFAFPLLGRAAPGLAREVTADLLLVAGTGWAVWSVRFLGRNLSVIAQAREIADRGPYRFVRHPLYSGEIVSALGLAVGVGTMPAYALWAALLAMQAYRARQEEQILLVTLPGYRDYRARTAALLPGIF